MATVKRTVVIDAPVEEVFNYIADPMNEVQFIPSIVEVSDVTRTETGVGSHYRWAYKMFGMRFRGESTCTEYVPHERMVTDSRGGIVSTWTYTFQPEDGATKMTLTIDYTIPVPVLGKFAEALVLRQNEREADLAMANLKAILEA